MFFSFLKAPGLLFRVTLLLVEYGAICLTVGGCGQKQRTCNGEVLNHVSKYWIL